MNQNNKRWFRFSSNKARNVLEFSIFDIVIIVFANRRHVVVSRFALRRREKKSKNNLRCFLLFECFVIDKKKEKSKDNFRCFLSLEDVVICRKKKSKSNSRCFFFRLNLVVAFINIVIRYFEIFARDAIIFVIFIVYA